MRQSPAPEDAVEGSAHIDATPATWLLDPPPASVLSMLSADDAAVCIDDACLPLESQA